MTLGGTVAVRGTRLAYETAGQGPDLVWGHGLTSSVASEDLMAEGTAPMIEWSRVPARVTRYDACGHGRSESTTDLDGYSWASLAADQLELASALGAERYVAAGASMGAGTALHAALAAPDRVDRLVLAIPPTAWETRAAQVDQWEATAHVIETRGVEPVITAGAELPPPDPFVDDVGRAERRAAAMRAWDPARLTLVLRGAAKADFPDRDAVASIAAPTLILAWTGDPVHPVESAQQLHHLLPNSCLHTASTAADLSRWTDVVAEFVAALPWSP